MTLLEHASGLGGVSQIKPYQCLDTITVLVGGRQQLKVRLAEIDAPEKSQAFGQRSKQSLSDLVFGKQVKVEQQGPGPLRPGRRTDLCGRSGCQRQAGQAWHGVGLS